MKQIPININSECRLSTEYIIYLLFLFISHHPLYAQEGRKERDALENYIQGKFGPDQELHRGHQFYNAYFQYIGDPYFPNEKFHEGSLVFNGLRYQGLQLRYDCFSQLLFLESSESEGQYNQISLDTSNIESFTLGSLSFRRLSLADVNPAFYQVIKKAHICCYIHWSTEATSINRVDRRYLYELRAPSGTFYIRFRDQLFPVSNKKSITDIFPETISSDLRKYMREKQISFKNALPGEIEELLEYLNNQLETYYTL